MHNDIFMLGGGLLTNYVP